VIDSRELRKTLFSLRAGLRGIGESPLVFGVSVLTIGAGLLVLSAYLLLVQNMRGVLERHEEGLAIVAFLRPGAAPDAADLERLRGALEALPGVSAVRFVAPDSALERLRAALGDQARVLEGLPRNPLPASFELLLSPAHRSPSRVRALAARAGSLPGIDDVRWGEAWVEGYARLLSALEWIGLAIGVCVGLVLCVIVAGTVRLALHTRENEIQIQRLVGAGGLFVRLPFFVEGALEGSLGAALALGALFLLFEVGLPLASAPIEFLVDARGVRFFGLREMAALLVLGSTLGLFSAAASLWRIGDSR
jgi:cell division transport system permease protein